MAILPNIQYLNSLTWGMNIALVQLACQTPCFQFLCARKSQPFPSHHSVRDSPAPLVDAWDMELHRAFGLTSLKTKLPGNVAVVGEGGLSWIQGKIPQFVTSFLASCQTEIFLRKRLLGSTCEPTFCFNACFKMQDHEGATQLSCQSLPWLRAMSELWKVAASSPGEEREEER